MQTQDSTKLTVNVYEAFPHMTCRKCQKVNPIVFFAPVNVTPQPATCVCFDCAKDRGWLTSDGDLRSDVTL